MKFKDLLKEKFAKGVEFRSGGYIEVFENPNMSELKQIMKSTKGDYVSIRFGAVDKPNGKIYAWNGENIVHEDMMKKIKFDFGYYYEPRAGNKDSLGHDHFQGHEWNDFKNQKSLLKKMKKFAPFAKTFRFWDFDEDDEVRIEL